MCPRQHWGCTSQCTLRAGLRQEGHPVYKCAESVVRITPDKGSKPKKERGQFGIKTVSIEYTYYLFI